MSNFFVICGDDVLILIISLLPPKQFFQCKRICKEWEKAIEKHRQDCEISIECVQRALHFLTWRDVVHSQKVIRQIEKNGNFRHTVTSTMKHFIGQQFYFEEIQGYERVNEKSVLTMLTIECDNPLIRQIIPIGEGFLTLMDESPTRIYYTKIDRINKTRLSWLLLEMDRIHSIIGVTKKHDTIVLCISSMECWFCWFDESKLSYSKDEMSCVIEEIDCIVEKLPRYDPNSNFYIPYCFGSLDDQACLNYYGHIVKYTFGEKKITNQSDVSIPFLKDLEKIEFGRNTMHCFLFFEKEKMYALSCEMGKITTCASPCYQNKALLSLECNTDPMARISVKKTIKKAFVINDILCIQLHTEEVHCFDFEELKKSMNDESLQSTNLPILKGIKLSWEWIESNHSFAILKKISVSCEKRKIQVPLFHLLHLDLFFFSTLNHLSPTPIYPPENFDFSEKQESNDEKNELFHMKMQECHFCLDGIYYLVESRKTTFGNVGDDDYDGEGLIEDEYISMLLFP